MTRVTDGHDAATNRTKSRWTLWVRRPMVVLAALLIVPTALALLLGQWASFRAMPRDLLFNDYALLELRVLSVGNRLVLLGPESRLGWMHPGPLLFYVMALPYRLLGGGVNGFLGGGLVVDVAAVVGCVVVAMRAFGRRIASLVGAGLAVFVFAFWPWVAHPWNPVVVVLPLVLLVLCAWAVAEGRVALLPLAALVASFIIQTHVGYTALAIVALGMGASFGALRTWRRRDGAPSVRRFVAWTLGALALLVILWAPPLVQQFTTTPGNIGLIAQTFSADEERPTLGEGARALDHELTLEPEWLSFSRWKSNQGSTPASQWYGGSAKLTQERTGSIGLPVVGIVFLVVGGIAVRRGGPHRSLFVILSALLLCGLFSLPQIIEPSYLYLFLWLPVLGLLVWLAIVSYWLQGHEGREGLSRGERILTSGAALVLCAAAGLRLLHETVDDPGWIVAVLALLSIGSVVTVALLRKARSGSDVAVMATCVAVVAVLSAITLVRARQAPFPDVGPKARSEATFATDVATRVRSHNPTGRIYLRWRSADNVEQVPNLVALALAQRGTDVTVNPRFVVPFGPELAKRPTGPYETLWIIARGGRPVEGTVVGEVEGLVAVLGSRSRGL